jgi:type IV secretion system protein VirB3
MVPGTDSVFKGATRPAMLFGVPLIPLIFVGGSVVMLSMWTTIFALVTLFPVVFVMRQITKVDDRQFHLLWLRFKFRVLHYNHNGRFWRASHYSPLSYFQRR